MAENVRDNRGLTAAEVELVRRLNIDFRERRWPSLAHHEVIALGTVMQLQTRTPEPAEARIVTPSWAVERANQLTEAAVARIRELDVLVMGGSQLPEAPLPPPAAGPAERPTARRPGGAAGPAVGAGRPGSARVGRIAPTLWAAGAGAQGPAPGPLGAPPAPAEAGSGAEHPALLDWWARRPTMAFYRSVGDVPPKRHTQHRRPDGGLYAEELMGEEGFSSDSALLYHREIPSAIVEAREWDLPSQVLTANLPLKPRHLVLHNLVSDNEWKRLDPVTGRRLVLGNADVRISYAVAGEPSPYYRNALGDECVYVEAGRAVVETAFGACRLVRVTT